MPEIIELNSQCPDCGADNLLAKAFAGAGQTYRPDQTIRCACGCLYIASGAFLSGAPAPVGVWKIPTLEGDAGGIGVLLLDGN